VLQTILDAMRAQESMDEKARARIYLGDSFGVEDLAPPTLSKELIGYFLSSDVTRHLLGRQSARGARWYYERPRLAFLRHGFVVGDWSQLQETPRFAEGVDLLNSPFRFLGHAGDATRLAAASGVADTALEQSMMRGEVFNTLPLFAAAGSQGIPTVSIRPGQGALLKDVAVPPPIRRVLEEELANGQLLVLPAGLVTLNGVRTFGWWSVDPATGFAIGKMELGGAQGLVEVTKMHERVEKWTEIFTKFYSGVMRCYLGALADNLGATPDALKTFKLKEGGQPGESPMPEMDKLAACVITQACDAIAELIVEASVTPAFAREADAAVEGLKQVIIRWVEEQAVEQLKGEVQGGVAAACEARMGAGGE